MPSSPPSGPLAPQRLARELAEATSWQPFKVVLDPGRPLYTTFGLVLWARSRAAGRLAPWESQA